MRIAVLVSGGVDSAVVVDLLYRQGHDLTLFYIRIGMDDGEGDCSAEEDIEFCSLIASRYELPFKIVSLHQEYWDYVMKYALDSAKKGLTPNPDMMCNKFIKFGFFEERYGHEFEKTATGHYARVEEIEGTYYLATAKDLVKDQTDFLSAISYSQLSHALFPIGGMEKAQVRQLALQAHLPNAQRKDSQGICFLGKIDYRDFIRRKLGEMPGDIVEIETGRRLGSHAGHWFHTVGQRKGLGLGGGPWFVVKKDIESNILYVSKGYDTPLQYSDIIPLQNIHWISKDAFADKDIPGMQPISTEDYGINVTFKIRHTPDFTEGVLRSDGKGYIISSSRRIQGVAPGQFATIYTPDRRICLGSGMIVRNMY